MTLIYRIIANICLVLLVVFTIWGILFYYITIDEVNDETDDSLELYSEYIIGRALAGEKLPESENGTNNSYYLTEVTAEYAEENPSVRYLDEMVYIHSKSETEPARIFKTIFKDKNDTYYELTVMIPTIEKDDLKQTILSWIIILYLSLLIVIIAINMLVLRRSLRPLYTILRWLGKLSVGKETPPLVINSKITEFNRLSEALLRSAQRNAELYEQQSIFIGHASHELQTPLAIALNHLEVLGDDPTLSESQLIEVTKTRRSLENITKLNKTLLLLTKIENKQFPDSKDVDVNELMRTLTSDFGEAYAHTSISCSVIEETMLTLHMNESLASVLFGNLIKNAYKYNKEGGEIVITIMPGAIRFANSATSGALNPEYIFRRFYQGQKREGSAGLGLSLAESICKLYGMKISYWYEDETHFFEVKKLF
ncbi:sensor histidine kinase [Bacteroides sp. 214]|uniref:PorY family sensor histidine kinase n=1 Tax=Bacteroides sp. 214 TaxID=2302935 RepID=UPI0013D77998|nr:histidine kinase dimerization/phospho-acceptor domain-containing protein [Bacteroides sp. 214]NDW13208.1 sensor histidine kinase [Bacteroides sp. 214]